jgi:protein-tyrosine phosphatase
MKILMVCLGNICRSPLAEGILASKVAAASLRWQVDSAGTNGFHTGEHPHHLSQKVALSHGIDISKQVSRLFVAEDFHRYDRIYAMAADVMDDMRRIAGNAFDEEKACFFLNELYPNENRNVMDPWYGEEDGYIEVFDQISATCNALVNNYLEQTKTAKLPA